MKTFLYLATALVLLSFTFSNEGDCETYFPIDKGMKWEYQDFDKNGKLQGYQSTEVTEEKAIANGTEYAMKITVDDAKKKEKNHFEREMTYSCENGILKMNLEGMIPAETMEGMKDMTITIDQTEMTIPQTLTAGESLKDAFVSMKAESNGIKVMDMKMDITDRKVEKMESITTDAGTFNCAVVSYKTTTKMAFMNTTRSTKDWYSAEAGLVRSESYDKNGALDSYRVLTGFSK